MAHFVRDHIGGSKIAGGAKAARQIIEEAGIKIDLLVCRAVEWPHAAVCLAAAAVHAAFEQVELWLRIGFAQLIAEHRIPGAFGAAQNLGDEPVMRAIQSGRR